MLSLVLSSTVQMKNSLVKYLDFETNNTHEQHAAGTQPFIVVRNLEDEATEMTVCTP